MVNQELRRPNRLCILVATAFVFSTFPVGPLSSQEADDDARPDSTIDKNYRLRRTDIVPHRGGRAAYPESTMHAYVRNLRHGVSMDADIRRTGDGDIVVIHDETTGRTCDRDYVVADKTVAELKTLDAAYHFDPQRDKTYPLRGSGVRIPTLDEVMRRFASEKRPNLLQSYARST